MTIDENEINLRKKRYRFPSQRENEKIVLVVRKHPIVLLPFAFHVFLLFMIPIIFYTFFIPSIFPAFYEYPYNRILLLIFFVYYGFVWIIAFTIWVDYYLDIWIITNERLVDVEQIGFFNRAVSELDLKRIQDITSRVQGMLPTMFSFGDIHLQTAAEEKKFELKSVPHPVTIRRTITELYRTAMENDRFIYKDRN